MKKKTLLLLPVAILVVGALLMMIFLGMRKDSTRTPQPQQPRMVASTTVTLGPIRAKLSAFGTVTSSQPVELYAEVAGTIMSGDVSFKPAQAFKSGDVLLRIDDRATRLKRKSTISDLLTALANVLPEIKVDFPDEFDVWQKYFDSVRFDRPVPALPEAGNQKTKLYLSRFNVYKLYFAVKDLEILLEKYEIRAPFDGNIVSTALRAGSSSRNGSLLGTIISLEDLEVEMPLPAADIPWIDYDRPVLFTSAEFEGQWQGRVRRVAGSIDGKTQTVPVYVGLERASEGMFLEGAFLEGAVSGRVIDSAQEVPRRAIYSDRYVYVVTDGKLEYREVTVARALKNSVIVNGGLHDGDTLVVEPLQGVTPGMPAVPRMISTSERGI